jgi:hypothetical protein
MIAKFKSERQGRSLGVARNQKLIAARKDQDSLREQRIDLALSESFPASDPPFFVAMGMVVEDADAKRYRKRPPSRAKAQ